MADQAPPLALVIGATSGIGRAIALRLAQDGHALAIVGRDSARGAATATACLAAGASKALFFQCDLAAARGIRPEQPLADLALALDRALGQPQSLVNAAGLLQSGQRVLAQDLAEDERLWRVNYRATLIACQIFGRQMAAAGGGAILNIGSLASFAPLALPAYAPGKQAIKSLTEILAAELGPAGVRVNAVAPGYTLSDGLKAKIATGERDAGAIQATAALRRFVQPSEVAEAAAFLLSPRASAITGVTLPVDAGWLVQAPYAQYLRGNPLKEA